MVLWVFPGLDIYRYFRLTAGSLFLAGCVWMDFFVLLYATWWDFRKERKSSHVLCHLELKEGATSPRASVLNISWPHEWEHRTPFSTCLSLVSLLSDFVCVWSSQLHTRKHNTMNIIGSCSFSFSYIIFFGSIPRNRIMESKEIFIFMTQMLFQGSYSNLLGHQQ